MTLAFLPRHIALTARSNPADAHLRRTMICEACGWAGEAGELIVRHVAGGLRCPRCDSDSVHSLRHPGTDAQQ